MAFELYMNYCYIKITLKQFKIKLFLWVFQSIMDMCGKASYVQLLGQLLEHSKY